MTGAALSHAGVATGRAAIAHHSRSFALASRLLPRAIRDRAVIVYAWCRRADDAVDAPGVDGGAAIARLGREVSQIYAGRRSGDPVLDGFAAIVREAGIPRCYPAELVAGMTMDATGQRYATERELRRYCFRVAGVVGLMMSHLMCLADPGALAAAARLGIAMQLTNICRDVREDWERGRLYIPSALLEGAGGRWLVSHAGGPLPAEARRALACAIARLLQRAGEDYRAADRGVPSLPPSCRPAVGAARRIYAAIGDEIARAGCDVLAPRAVVPGRRKLALAALAAGEAAWSAVRTGRGPRRDPRELPVLRFEDLA